MSITKRDHVDNSIFTELLVKYPPLSADNGVAYKQKLDYLTFEIDFIKNPTLRMLIQEYGHSVISIIFYLRTTMCENGWKIRVDNSYYRFLVEDCSHICNIDIKTTEQVLKKLIEYHFFYVVQDNNVEEGTWMTCTQQIYNYEMACNNRQQGRKRKSKSRENAQAAGSVQNERLQCAVEQIDEFSPFNGAPCDDFSRGSIPNNGYPVADAENRVIPTELEDNPFGLG